MGKNPIYIPNTTSTALILTASLSESTDNTITFEKTDGSEFDITINTGSQTDISDLNNFTSSYLSTVQKNVQPNAYAYDFAFVDNNSAPDLGEISFNVALTATAFPSLDVSSVTEIYVSREGVMQPGYNQFIDVLTEDRIGDGWYIAINWGSYGNALFKVTNSVPTPLGNVGDKTLTVEIVADDGNFEIGEIDGSYGELATNITAHFIPGNPVVTPGGEESLAETLVFGKFTGGNDVVFSVGDLADFTAAGILGQILLLPNSSSFEHISAGQLSFTAPSMVWRNSLGTQYFDVDSNGSVQIGAAGISGSLIFNREFLFDIDFDELTANRTETKPDGNINWTSGSVGWVMTKQADGSFMPQSFAEVDISSLNSFTSSYFIDSASFSSSISDLNDWSSSLVIPDGVDISALNSFTQSYFIDSSSFSSSIADLEEWSGSFAETQGLSNVLSISPETNGNDIVVSENDVIDFRANNVSVMIFSGSEDIAYGDGDLSLRDFDIVSFTSGSGVGESKMIQLRKINSGLSDLLIGNSSGINGELSIFNSSNVITYKTETLTDSRSIYLPDSDIIWTGSIESTFMGYDLSSNKWQPTIIPPTDLSSLNQFTSSYFIDSASFSSSIAGLNQWSSSFTISDFLDTGSFATTASNIFFGDQYVQGDITASHVLISGSDQNQLTIQGSGSDNPLVTVEGSTGELFTITDSLSGSLLQVNSSSGESIFEVFSDQSIHMGSVDLPIKFTSKLKLIDSGSTVIYDINTSSYDGAFFEYTLKSGSNLRSGNVMSIWGNGEINYNETTTVDIGDTSAFIIGMDISGSYARLSGSSNSDDWVFKTLIKTM